MKKLFFSVLLMVPFCMNAQRVQSNYASEKAASKTTFVNEGGHWFLTVSGGASHLFSEGSSRLDLFDNVQSTVGLSVGKWMSPVWGIRLNATGTILQGYTLWNEATGSGTWYKGVNYSVPGGYGGSDSYVHANASTAARDYVKNTFLGDQKNDKDGKNGYKYDVPYLSGSLDMMLNVNNLFVPYNSSRVFNFILLGGVGYAHTFKDKDKGRTAVNSIMGKGGFIADFRLSDAVNLGLEANAMVLPENFDRQVGGKHSQDLVANVMLGLTYKFKQRNFEKAVLKDQGEIDALNSQINSLRAENDELRKRPVSCPACPACPEPVVVKEVVKKTLDYLPKPVFFRINSSVIDDAQWSSIEEAVRYLRTTPDARLKLTGYADKATGTAAGNKKLSEKRALAVYNAMVKKYNIDPRRIETHFMGDDVQPFTENDWNRVVVFVKE